MTETDGRSRTQMAVPADVVPLLRDLASLDEAGELGGLRAVTAACRGRVRAGADAEHTADFLLRAAREELARAVPRMDRDGFATAAALLAAVIGRLETAG